MAVYGRFIEDFPNYSVTSEGVVFSHKKSGVVERKVSKAPNGYKRLDIYKEGLVKYVSVHRQVALLYIDNPYNKPYVNHINGIKTDNRVENLEWVTEKENGAHAAAAGLYRPRRGRDCNFSVLNETQVLEIFDKAHNSKTPQKKIAELYNVSINQVYRIKTGRSWGHLTGRVVSREEVT